MIVCLTAIIVICVPCIMLALIDEWRARSDTDANRMQEQLRFTIAKLERDKQRIAQRWANLSDILRCQYQREAMGHHVQPSAATIANLQADVFDKCLRDLNHIDRGRADNGI